VRYDIGTVYGFHQQQFHICRLKDKLIVDAGLETAHLEITHTSNYNETACSLIAMYSNLVHLIIYHPVFN
jgi:hypothetical protein